MSDIRICFRATSYLNGYMERSFFNADYAHRIEDGVYLLKPSGDITFLAVLSVYEDNRAQLKLQYKACKLKFDLMKEETDEVIKFSDTNKNSLIENFYFIKDI